MSAKLILDQLKEPFDPKVIHWRVGATSKDKSTGIALAYLDARDVMKRLDDVLGIDGWQDEYEEFKNMTICKLSLKINNEWIVKCDGAGETDVEAEKGMISDAFKRAAVKFGVGRYLYYLPTEWVPLKPAGRSYQIASVPGLPAWAKPGKHRFKPGEANEIINQVTELLNAGDEMGLRGIASEYQTSPEEWQKFLSLFNSTERSVLSTYLKETANA